MSTCLRQTYGCRILSSSRPVSILPSGAPPDQVYGGTLVIVFNPNRVAMRPIHSDPRGLLAVELCPPTSQSPKAPSWAP